MAVIETWYRQDLKQPVSVHYLDGNVFSQDNGGNLVGVEVFDDGEPATLSGSVSGLAIRSDGATVAISGGALSGNKCSIILPQSAYSVPGVVSVILKLTSGTTITTLCAVVANVYRSTTDTVIDPGTIIPNISTLVAEIEAAIASIPADYSSLWASLAPNFSTSKAYPIGEYCTYNGKLYRFTTAHSAGSWNSSHVVETNIGAEMNWLLTERVPHFININYSGYEALTFGYDSANNVYSITANKNFSMYGYSTFSNLISMGYGTNVDYPMPASVTANNVSTSTFAVICYDRTDKTSATWKIVAMQTFVGNSKLMAIAAAYKDRVYFFNDNMKVLFTNSVSDDVFLTYENNRIRGAALYYPFLCNATALIAGNVNYIPSEYKVVITHPIIGPTSNVGSFSTALQNETITIDWSQEPNPGFVRFIYFDNETTTFFSVCSGNLTSAEKDAYRRKKAALSLMFAVYQGTFVYTCGACTPGKWFVNGNDVYGGASSEFPPDLFNAFKKVGVIGDSLSVGYMMNKSTGVATSRMLAYSWVKKVMNNAGVPWLNLGTSGQNVLTWCSNATYGKVQAEASGNKCQMYIIGLGENDQSDSTRGIPLGTSSDIVDNYQTAATTYYGGYARIIQILKHLNPDCKIFCLTNPRTGGNRADYNVAVRYIAGTYYTAQDNVFLVDLANNMPELFNGGTFLPVDSAAITGGHYSAVGYSRIASIIEKAITKAIEANQAQFVDIPYIAYDTTDPTPNTMTE